MKKLTSILLAVLIACLPVASLAASKKMNDDVPVWTEETVKQYARDFIDGNDFERLWGYYDLQIRRYMPMDTFTGMLTEIAWLTGDFIEFGTYSEFTEPAQKTATHVLHLCMEKQDLDLFFTHKDQEDDWEVMAVEFVPGEEQETSDYRDLLLTEDGEAAQSVQPTATPAPTYTETQVTVGEEPYLLNGILTLPADASATSKVPAVVLVHGSGPSDMDETIGQTKLFADIAKLFAQKGIATLRYDKRTYTYGASMTAEEIAAITVEEETIQDAISAAKLLSENECVDSVVLLGHSMGAMLAPRIASEANGLFSGMILVAGTPKSLLEVIILQSEAAVEALSGDDRTAADAQIDTLRDQLATLQKDKTGETARTLTVAGINGYYFWEMMQVDACKLIKKLKLPTYIVQGSEDWQIANADGVDAYEDTLGDTLKYVDYKAFRRLNHLLMQYDGPTEVKGTIQEYDTPATLDISAGRDLADWVLKLGKTEE